MNNNKFTERQIQIIEAATKRIDEHGIQDLTIKTLAADLNLSEAALYRHFKSKNEILLGLLTYFIEEMKERLGLILSNKDRSPSELLKDLFDSQLKTFVKKPSVVSVIFSEGIFQFNKELSSTVSSMMELMQNHIEDIVKKGQANDSFSKIVGVSITTTIIMGGMRITVLKWKLSGHNSDLIKDGNKVLSGILKMIETK
ncbi:MAG: TetR/AcrR family transcriptional regulator [Bacteroidetes bacterium]|jgi:TetR/AcrR family fatty acid metabolism transcriptional regulator|nr:TetR/AcrR family transcriptional regulator [Bacteroidota bacterium]MBK8366909.1 TetR/AcrR family transcriptional regulator [Bacteroidota bacterium]MBL7935560.1 TetR/AcrR family transcriptional regulator [Bacteroidia bacterium]